MFHLAPNPGDQVTCADQIRRGIPNASAERLNGGEPQLTKRGRINLKVKLVEQCSIGLIYRDLNHWPAPGHRAGVISEVTPPVGYPIIDHQLHCHHLLRADFSSNLELALAGGRISEPVTGGFKRNIVQ
jgi:hypothetical protein